MPGKKRNNSGVFVHDPTDPPKARVSLRVNERLLNKFKDLRGKGFSGELAKVIDDYLKQCTEQ